ncbi:taurine catabolism dioxygenase, partial [Moniliophthora roreri]
PIRPSSRSSIQSERIIVLIQYSPLTADLEDREGDKNRSGCMARRTARKPGGNGNHSVLFLAVRDHVSVLFSKPLSQSEANTCLSPFVHGSRECCVEMFYS